MILRFIVDNSRCENTVAADGGEEGGGEALLAIKERFRRNILKRLEAFDLSEEQKQQLRQGGKGVKGRGGRSQTRSHLASD